LWSWVRAPLRALVSHFAHPHISDTIIDQTISDTIEETGAQVGAPPLSAVEDATHMRGREALFAEPQSLALFFVQDPTRLAGFVAACRNGSRPHPIACLPLSSPLHSSTVAP
jgi:hypothetical protein